MHTILHGTGIEHELSIIRAASTPMNEFRQAMYRIGLHLAVEVSKHLPHEERTVTTPLTTTTAHVVSGEIVLIPVLRAGLGLLDAFLHIMPSAKVGFEGLRRNEESLIAEEYYSNLPSANASTTFVVLDPMIATGGSLSTTLTKLTALPHAAIIAAGVIAAPEGLATIERNHPLAHVIVGALDDHLNDVGYIVPGLGDAGDRLFGTE